MKPCTTRTCTTSRQPTWRRIATIHTGATIATTFVMAAMVILLLGGMQENAAWMVHSWTPATTIPTRTTTAKRGGKLSSTTQCFLVPPRFPDFDKFVQGSSSSKSQQKKKDQKKKGDLNSNAIKPLDDADDEDNKNSILRTNWLTRIVTGSSSSSSSSPDAATTVITTSIDRTSGDKNNSSDNVLLLSSSYISNNIVNPIQTVLDEQTGGWALSYADLSPDTPQTLAGQAFLATNAAYLSAGLGLQYMSGDVFLGVVTDLCAAASFHYHFRQLQASGQTAAESVRYALLLDYIFACTAIGLATVDLFQTTGNALLSGPNGWQNLLALQDSLVPAVTVATAGVGFLTLSWKYEYGKPYMLWHSLWHLASAYAGFLIGDLHAAAATAATTVATSSSLSSSSWGM